MVNYQTNHEPNTIIGLPQWIHSVKPKYNTNTQHLSVYNFQQTPMDPLG